MSVVFNAATAANVSVLQITNSLFQIAQKRVATGKSIFGAADEATRYTMSQTMLSRAKNINSVNANISTALKTLESTDKTLTAMRNLLQQMNEMANRALNAGSTPTVAVNFQPSGAGVSEISAVAGGSSNTRLSITSDNGKNFTYTFQTAAGGTTWGQVAQALNNANIGVTMRFEVVGTASRMVLEATDKSTGFTIDGATSQSVMTQISSGLNSGYDGSFNISRFVGGAGHSSVPSFGASSTPYGMRFGTGGAVVTASTGAAPSSVAAGSSITFTGNDGLARTWVTTTVKNLDVVASEINAMNAGVKAEIVAAGRLQLRNMAGNSITILNGTADFDASTGALRFNSNTASPIVQGNPILGATNNEIRLKEGANYEAYKTELTALIQNNVVQAGRNLLRGESVSIILNEFSANAITVSGINTSVTGNLGLITLGTSWTTNGNISAAQGEVKSAMQVINNLQAQFGTYSSFVKDRFDLNREFSTELKTLGDDLVAADVAEESAKLTALQTQQQFAVQAFTAGTQNAQGLLRLLG